MALKTGKIGAGPAAETHTQQGIPRVKVDNAQEHRPADLKPDHPAKPGRRPWVWPALGRCRRGGEIGVWRFLLSLFAVVREHRRRLCRRARRLRSARRAGHVAKVYVTDNQWVNQGNLLGRARPRDYEARLAARRRHWRRLGRARSRARSDRCHEITSTAGVEDASAAVEGATPAVETARAAVATAKSQQAQPQAQVAVIQRA